MRPRGELRAYVQPLLVLQVGAELGGIPSAEYRILVLQVGGWIPWAEQEHHGMVLSQVWNLGGIPWAACRILVLEVSAVPGGKFPGQIFEYWSFREAASRGEFLLHGFLRGIQRVAELVKPSYTLSVLIGASPLRPRPPRPYGSTILMATYDKSQGPALHVIEPSGTSFRFYGAAVGKGRQLARNEIEKLKLSEMTCRCACLCVCGGGGRGLAKALPEPWWVRGGGGEDAARAFVWGLGGRYEVLTF